MAKKTGPKLKLFKTVIGFHDAYVAAPSRKAALHAWGASTDLFSAGLAEQVADADSCTAAFAEPGTVVTMKRGSAREWSARARPKPRRPSKKDLAKARIEQRLAKLDERRSKALGALDREADTLRRKRSALETKFDAERGKLEAERDALD